MNGSDLKIYKYRSVMGISRLITNLQAVNIYTKNVFFSIHLLVIELDEQKRTEDEEPLLPSPPSSPPSEQHMNISATVLRSNRWVTVAILL